MKRSTLSPSSRIRIETNGALGVVTLDRPEKRNAISEEMIVAVGEAFAKIPADWKAIVLRAEGPNFSAGLDLSEHRERSPEAVLDISALWHRVTQSIADCGVPVVCALKGYVVGAGLELASAAHVRIADPNSRFSLPEGRRGIFVGGGASVRVGRLIGTSRLMELMLSGREMGAQEAFATGLCQRLSAPESACDEAIELGREIAGNAPLSNRMILQALANIAEMPPGGGLFTESLAAALTQTSPEAVRRINAFFDGQRR